MFKSMDRINQRTEKNVKINGYGHLQKQFFPKVAVAVACSWPPCTSYVVLCTCAVIFIATVMNNLILGLTILSQLKLF